MNLPSKPTPAEEIEAWENQPPVSDDWEYEQEPDESIWQLADPDSAPF